MALEHLAPELLALILQKVDTPEDLHRFISASPTCYRVFSQSPQLFLSSVIKNAFLGDNIRHGLAILQAPATKDKVPAFLEKYFTHTYSFDFPKSKADLLALFRLYSRVSYFIDIYFQEKMQLLSSPERPPYPPQPRRPWIESPYAGFGQCEENQRDDSIGVPSQYERTRLQRAFLRFELYCRAFPGHESDPWGPGDHTPQYLPPDQQFSLFLANLTPWEVEEISCVQEYFLSIISESIDKFEQDFVNAVHATPGQVLITSPEQSSQAELREDEFQDFYGLDMTNLILFSSFGRNCSPDYIGYMTSLGLDFMYDFTGPDEKKRVQMVRSNHPVEREFFQEALSHSPALNDTREDDVYIMTDDDGGDDPSQSNIGYRQFAGQDGYLEMSYSGTKRLSALRQLGYVFWDAKRIQSPENFEKLSVANKCERRGIDGRYDRRFQKCAGDRLWPIRVPIEEFKRLEREFGTFLYDD